MPSTKISALTADTTPLVADIVPLVNVADFSNKKVTVGNLTNQINVKQYGALGDGRYVSDGAITSGTKALTSATAAFTAADVGKLVIIEGAGAAGATYAGTITAVTSGTAATVSVNASTTVSAKNVTFGSDDTTAINAAVTAGIVAGSDVFFPAGLYMVSSQINVAGSIVLRGEGLDYSVVTAPVRKGSVIICGAAMTSVVQLGTSLSTSSGLCGASMERMAVDGMSLATNAVSTGSRRNYIYKCQIWRGVSYALNMSGQNGYCYFCIIGQQSIGTGILSSQPDNKIFGCQIRECKVTGIELTGQTAMVQQNHVFTYSTGMGYSVWIHDVPNTNGDIQILGNTLEVATKQQVYITGKASTSWGRVIINDNVFYEVSGFANNTYAIVALDVTASSSVINTVTIMGNTFAPLGGGNWKAIVEKIGSGGTLSGITVIGNVGNGVTAIASGFRPESMLGNIVNTTGTTMKFSDNGGAATLSGDGATTAFTIAHNIYGTPNHVTVTAGSAAAATDFYITYDGTNITVTFLTAPASGTNNLILNWRAWL